MRIPETAVLVIDQFIAAEKYRYAEHLLDRLSYYPIEAPESAILHMRYAEIREKTGNPTLAVKSYKNALAQQDLTDELRNLIDERVSKLLSENDRLMKSSKIETIQFVEPAYPNHNGFVRPQGNVLVEFSVNTEGKAHSAKILESRPPDFFDQAVLTALEQSLFQPKYVDGRPVEVSGIKRVYRFTNWGEPREIEKLPPFP